MRLALVLAVSLLAAPALAQPAAAADEPICTTVTTVVKKGEVVLSTNTTTRCERQKGAAGLPGAAEAAAEPFREAEGVLGGLFGPAELKPRQVRGDWKVVQGAHVCHLILMSEITPQGRKVRAVGCAAPVSGATAWKLED